MGRCFIIISYMHGAIVLSSLIQLRKKKKKSIFARIKLANIYVVIIILCTLKFSVLIREKSLQDNVHST